MNYRIVSRHCPALHFARVGLLAAVCLAPAFRAAAQLPATEPEHTVSTTPKPAAHAPAAGYSDNKGPRTADSAVTPVNRNAGRHADFMDRIKEGPIDLLFLGDSITDFWNRRGEWTWDKFAAYNPANFGVSGERTEDVLWRITHGELDNIHPKVTVIMIGTNNIGQHKDEKAEWTAAGVRKVVTTVHEKLPGTKVLLLGIFPRDKFGSPYRQQVKQINDEIARFDDGNRTRFLDIGGAFLDPEGNIPKDVMADALHPTPKGYVLWYDAMHPLLDEMMK